MLNNSAYDDSSDFRNFLTEAFNAHIEDCKATKRWMKRFFDFTIHISLLPKIFMFEEFRIQTCHFSTIKNLQKFIFL